MNETDRRQFEEELGEALAAESPAEVLDALGLQYRTEPERARRIGEARRLVGELSALGERLEAAEATPLGKLELPADRHAWWRRAIPAAAAAAAAAALLAVSLQGPPTKVGPDPEIVSATQPEEHPLVWRVPELTPVSLAEDFSTPEVTLPSMSSFGIVWQIPQVSTGEYSERRDDDETQETDRDADRRGRGGGDDRLRLRHAGADVRPA
jgi:hypothetical protein